MAKRFICEHCPPSAASFKEVSGPSTHVAAASSGGGHARAPPTDTDDRGNEKRVMSSHLAAWRIVWDWALLDGCPHGGGGSIDGCQSSSVTEGAIRPQPTPTWFLIALVDCFAENVTEVADVCLRALPAYFMLLLACQVHWAIVKSRWIVDVYQRKEQRETTPPSPYGMSTDSPRSIDVMTMGMAAVDDDHQAHLHGSLARLEKLLIGVLGHATFAMIEDLQCFCLALIKKLPPAQQSHPHNSSSAIHCGPLLSRMRAHVHSICQSIGWMSDRALSALQCTVVDGGLEPVLKHALKNATDSRPHGVDSEHGRDGGAALLYCQVRDEVVRLLASSTQRWECSTVSAEMVVHTLGEWLPNLTTLHRLIAAT